MILRLTFIFLFSFPLIACARTIHWQQQVQLQDGRIITLNRISKQKGPGFPEPTILEYGQTLSFTNPDTNEKITWSIPDSLYARMLDFDQKIPYIVFRAGSVGDYNTWNCPNPPHIIFRYMNHKWQQIALAQLPDRFTKPNLLDAAVSDKKASADGLVTLTEMYSYFHDDISPGLVEEFTTISRKKIHPIGRGCYPSVLVKEKRESEINIEYYKGDNLYKAGVLIKSGS